MAMTLNQEDLDAIEDMIEANPMIKAIHAALVGNMDHDEDPASASVGQDRVIDSDGSTVLATLRTAADIEVTGANWTDLTKYLVQVDAFTGYLWRSGDQITLTAGTGVVAGQYEIVGKIDDDTIELAADINAAAGDIADNSVVGTIFTGRIMRTVV